MDIENLTKRLLELNANLEPLTEDIAAVNQEIKDLLGKKADLHVRPIHNWASNVLHLTH